MWKSFCCYLVSSFWPIISDSGMGVFVSSQRTFKSLKVSGVIRKSQSEQEGSLSCAGHKSVCKGKSDLAAFEWRVWRGSKKPTLTLTRLPSFLGCQGTLGAPWEAEPALDLHSRELRSLPSQLRAATFPYSPAPGAVFPSSYPFCPLVPYHNLFLLPLLLFRMLTACLSAHSRSFVSV